LLPPEISRDGGAEFARIATSLSIQNRQNANGTKIQRTRLREMAIERLRPPHAA
jgi:hypothetical protein